MTGKLRKIAVEEAFGIREIAKEMASLASSPSESLDLTLLKGVYNGEGTGVSVLGKALLDIEDRRLAEMDQHGVDMQLLSLHSPGVQMFDADTACELATNVNDRLAEIISRRPTRFGGLATFAPQAPKRAAKEMQRAIEKLKLNGFLVNSHTNNEYFDDPKFWPILEVAEALNACIYIHPRCASDTLKGPLQLYGMQAAMWGYGVEVSTHVVRMLASGVFDRFPKLKICLGHMGEGIPFWIWRISHVHNVVQKLGRAPKTQLTLDEYFKRNFVITTSGMEDPLALEYAIRKVGADNVLWAIDYPFEASGSAVAFMDAAPIKDTDKAKIYHQNAERVFHIKPQG